MPRLLSLFALVPLSVAACGQSTTTHSDEKATSDAGLGDGNFDAASEAGARSQCGVTGPHFLDLQTLEVGSSAEPDENGTWWCAHASGAGVWECVANAGLDCAQATPADGTVSCGRLDDEGRTDYCGAFSNAAPFGYGALSSVLVPPNSPLQTGNSWCQSQFSSGPSDYWNCRSVSGGLSCSDDVSPGELVDCSQYSDVRTVHVGASPSGRTAAFWCANNFAANLGDDWDCLSTTASSCTSTVSNGDQVVCGRFIDVAEAGFAPVACTDPSLDSAEQAFCQGTAYMTTRTASTLYLYNDYVRAGFNRSFGATLFELYGDDAVNLLEEHGNSGAQIGVFGYDQAATGTAYFTTTTCDPTPYDQASCSAQNKGSACRAFPQTGAQISDCTDEVACDDWSAGAPWNAMQARGSGCAWDGDSNDVTDISEANGVFTFRLGTLNEGTKSTPLAGMSLQISAQVPSGSPYVQLDYELSYDGTRNFSLHNQELPAIIPDPTFSHWYYFYGGDAPYADARGLVTRQRVDLGTELMLPGRAQPLPEVAPAYYAVATEDWQSSCSADEKHCLTVATFSPLAKTISQRSDMTPLSRFALGTKLDFSFRVYLFPYRYDQVIGGQSVREWIYELHQKSPR